MRYLLPLLLLVLLVTSKLSAQDYNPDYVGRIVVEDESSNALIGATVTLICGADTLRGVTSKRVSGGGRVQGVYKCNRFFKAPVTVRVSYVGYKPVEERVPLEEFNRGVFIRMQEDEMQIGQIVVVGNSIAMVIKGDTTVYNATAFKTMEGDRFMELIKQLPGVEIKGSKIYAGDQEIKRVYVDGRNMFGLNAGFALSDLEASDVKSVKVYDEQNAFAKRTGDTQAPKEKVMDVVTYSKREVIKGGNLELLGGASFERDYSGKHEPRHRESATLYRNTERGNLRFEATNSKDDGTNGSAGSRTSPLKHFEGRLSHEYRRGDSTSVMTYVNIGRDRARDLDASTTDYFSTSEYTLRRIESQNSGDKRSFNTVVGNQTILQRGRSSISALAEFKYDNSDARSLAQTMQDIDGKTTLTDTRSDNTNRNYELLAVLAYRGSLSKKTQLSARASVLYSNSTGSGWRVDTLASDPGLRVLLNNELRGRRLSLAAQAEVEHAVSDHSSFAAKYEISYTQNKARQLSTDFLDFAPGRRDSVNSYDYTVQSMWNTVTGKWIYSTERTRLEVALDGVLYNVNRREFFPAEEYAPRHFLHLVPRVMFSTSQPKRSFNANFEVFADPMQPEWLRNSLDATNPQFLSAGNPGLKPTRSASLILRYSLTNPKSARTLSFGASAQYKWNYIAARQQLFKEETYLPEYDYTARQWSQLSTYVNVDGYYFLTANVDYSQRIAPLKSTLRLGTEYRYTETPYLLEQTQYSSQKHEMNLKVGFISGFSTKVRLGINSTTALGQYSTQDGSSRYIRELLTGNFDAQIAKRYFTKVSCIYDMYRNDRSKSLAQDDVMLNAEVGCKFGKGKKFSAAIGAVNLLDQVSYLQTTFNADYVRTSNTSYLGRYGYVKLNFEF